MNLKNDFQDRIEFLRRKDLCRLGQHSLAFIAVPLFGIAAYVDIQSLGKLDPLILFRLLFVPIGLALAFSYRLHWIKERPAVPIAGAVCLISFYLLIMVSRTGFDQSLFNNGLAQCLMIITVLPLTWAEFLWIEVPMVVAYFLLVLLFGGTGLSAFREPNFAGFPIYVVLAFLLFYFMHRTRAAYYAKSVEQEEDLATREQIIANKVSELLATKMELEIERVKTHHLEELHSMAAQVSHDIRSPLAALEFLSKDLNDVSEEKRTLLRSAIGRIKDIAILLLEKNRIYLKTELARISPQNTVDAQKPTIQLLSSLIDSVISEKRLQIRSKPNLEIAFDLAPTAFGIFAQVHPREFKRVISNLIENAIEATPDRGRVTVFLERSDDVALLSITDTGSGIPENIVPLLMKKGATFGKPNGTGLGLFHASQTIAQYAGTLTVEPAHGKGTTVKARIPIAQTPHWFPQKIQLKNGSRIIILDDESSIHQIWERRFNPFKAAEHQVEVIHLTKPAQISSLLTKAVSLENTIILMDYEFIGENINGLRLIETLRLEKQSILVTSRFENPKIREKCEQYQIKLLPKEMAGFIPLETISDENS